ncbi:MAG: general secretion pathway protein GspB [Acidiferrobacterales bacterium]
MSYILDALKKSEEERELSHMLDSENDGLSASLKRPFWPVAIGLALLLIVSLTSLRVWWQADEPQTVTMAEPIAQVAPSLAQRSSATKLEPVTKVAVGDLAEQTRLAAKKAQRRKITQTKTRHVEPAMPKVSQAAARQTTIPALTPRGPQELAAVPFLRQMPNEFRRSIPKLAVNVHLYSADEAENLVYINNRQYRKGEQIKGGLRLEEIVEEGVVLSRNGVYFKLPRPN